MVQLHGFLYHIKDKKNEYTKLKKYIELCNMYIILVEPRHEKTCIRGFRPDLTLTQSGLYSKEDSYKLDIWIKEEER